MKKDFRGAAPALSYYGRGLTTRPNPRMSPETIRFAADVIRQSVKDRPADAALREALKANETLTAAQRREIAQAVFTYYRWRGGHDREREVESRIAWSEGL